jgi:RNA polymerase sigma-70 factor (ECF subfamily)
LSDSDCIERAKNDERYFAPLYEKYFETVFRFVFKRVNGNEELTGDLTQLTFLKAMAKIHQYEDRGFQFSSWLIRIAINEINQFFRSEKHNLTVSISENELRTVLNELDSDHDSKIEDLKDKEADLEKLIEKINNLDQDQRELIEMRFFDELSFKEIAEILDTTEANAKMKVYRILEKVKKSW